MSPVSLTHDPSLLVSLPVDMEGDNASSVSLFGNINRPLSASGERPARRSLGVGRGKAEGSGGL
jgi:hypothetical protein